MKRTYIFLMLTALLVSISCQAQDWKSLGADDLFLRARAIALNGDRKEARAMLQHLLQKSPGYHDARILLGRTYAWDGQREAAREEFNTVLAKSPENLDALNALTDVEMWDERYPQALDVTDRGIKAYPNDEDLLYKRASILNSLKRQDEALLVLNKLLTINPAHEKGNILLKSIKTGNLKYTAGVSYGVDLFSRIFDPAHYVSAQLARTNSWGSSIVRVNYARRFRTNGIQPEIDLYPRIANGVYAYLNYGYSATDLFPLHRMGAELFTKLPKSFEASAGFRHLYFESGSKVTIFTGSVGWYVKNYWLSVRPYITPDKQTGTSLSGSLTLRRYFKDAETYLSLSGSVGFSPDLRRIQSGTGLSSDEIYLLHSQRVGASFQKLIGTDLVLSFSADFSRQELIFDAGNYVAITSLGIGLKKKF
jgi:YaiO family outer membrane protein